ncbi:spt3 [Colletotrichum musicola]|uniref:Spt3 n=1 Tax=Colletotrichum musicola TaxID=2175873 RepID=A0A8H6N6X1_9PEZI|nr:spt3 [Colletotrichum musicola]
MEPRFKQEIQQMMYIAGETQDPSTQTVKLIEDILLDQVVHMLKTANDLALRRGSRVFSNNDLIFQFRHDTARVDRLRTFLAWKAIRRTVKDADDKDTFADEDIDAPAPEESPLSAPAGKAKFPTVSLPWDVSSFFPEHPLDADDDETGSSAAALEKLRRNDERTRDMSVAEYATWSEYRHASLTYRKAKRFREWCGLGVVAENRPGDDVMDILGFLTAEMVQGLTAEALVVQRLEMARRARCRSGREDSEGGEGRGLFSAPEGVREPVGERHVRMAFQKMQGRTKNSRALLKGTRLPASSGLRLVSESRDIYMYVMCPTNTSCSFEHFVGHANCIG